MTAKKRRIWPAVAAAGVMLLALTGCALEDGGSGDEAGKEGLTKVKVGYLHTVAVDSHLWLGQANKTFEKHGLQIEPVKFDTGIAESQALTGGSIDVAMMGAVVANFPARGQGKVFLLNDVEYDTAQLWVSKDSGIEKVSDLKGKKVATTEGTTAHVYLHNALKKEGVDPKDVEIVNSAMPAAVNAFVSGAVPASVLWVPFDLQVKKSLPDAKLISSAKDYYPDSAIAGGWVANNSFYENKKDVLQKLAAAWLEINAELTGNTEESLKKVHETGYKDDMPLEQVRHNFGFEKTFDNATWAKYFEDGTAAGWLGATTRTFVEVGGLPEYTDPAEYFDTEILLNAYKETK